MSAEKLPQWLIDMLDNLCDDDGWQKRDELESAFHRYAAEVRAAAVEECAKVVEESWRDRPLLQPANLACEEISVEIRALLKKETTP